MIEWNSVLNRLRRDLMRKLMRRRRLSRADAEDVIQEAWLRSHVYSKENEVHNMESLIESSANNVAIDRYRHAQRHPQEPEDLHRLEQRLPLVSPARNPHEVLVADERLYEIRDALNELQKGTGDIFLARYVGFSHKELAAAFGLSTSAIEKRMARIMQWLQEQEE
jgi:RNA polymerase sigma factor (sigma-70 family)